MPSAFLLQTINRMFLWQPKVRHFSAFIFHSFTFHFCCRFLTSARIVFFQRSYLVAFDTRWDLLLQTHFQMTLCKFFCSKVLENFSQSGCFSRFLKKQFEKSKFEVSLRLSFFPLKIFLVRLPDPAKAPSIPTFHGLFLSVRLRPQNSYWRLKLSSIEKQSFPSSFLSFC